MLTMWLIMFNSGLRTVNTGIWFSGYPLGIKHGREKSPVNGGLLMRKSSLNGGLTRQAMFDYQMVIYIYI